MKVYIPFDDGSVISYDGDRFAIHRRPVAIDADLSELSDGAAASVWRSRRGELVKALETAWWKEHERRGRSKNKKIYSNARAAESGEAP
jgi:hypothetical protein